MVTPVTFNSSPDGTTGVWFLSLDAARLIPVITAQVTLRLPYAYAPGTGTA